MQKKGERVGESSHQRVKRRSIGESAEESAGSSGSIKKGSRVFHQKFGYGRITVKQDDHLTIVFDKAGTKKVLADFVDPA